MTPAWSALERRPRSRREATGCWLSHERLLRSGPPLIEHTRQRQLLTRTAVLLRKTKCCTSTDARHSSSGRTVAAHLRATRGPRSARQARRLRRELLPLPSQPARRHLLRRRRDRRRCGKKARLGVLMKSWVLRPRDVKYLLESHFLRNGRSLAQSRSQPTPPLLLYCHTRHQRPTN